MENEVAQIAAKNGGIITLIGGGIMTIVGWLTQRVFRSLQRDIEEVQAETKRQRDTIAKLFDYQREDRETFGNKLSEFGNNLARIDKYIAVELGSRPTRDEVFSPRRKT